MGDGGSHPSPPSRSATDLTAYVPSILAKAFRRALTALTVHIPRLNDGPDDFLALAHIWRQVDGAGDGATVSFDFSGCMFLQPNAVVFLGGLAGLIRHQGGTAKFLVTTMIDRVHVNLLQNGFAHAMGADTEPWLGNSI